MTDPKNDDENIEATEESFAAMLDAYSPGLEAALSVGDKIRGRVISIGRESIFVDTGTKVDGVVDRSEMLDKDQQLDLAEGDMLELYVVGLTDDEILRITKGPDDPGWSDFDAALIRAADELFHDAIISDATWNALSQRYDEKQLMDVVFTVGQYNMVSWALNSLGVQLEEGVPGFPEGSR